VTVKTLFGILKNKKTLRKFKQREKRNVFEIFKSFDEPTRFNIANACAAINSENSRKLLVVILEKDRSLLVRHEAAFALGCVGNHGSVTSLRHALRCDSSFLVRHEAAIALSEVGSKRDIAILERGLKDRSREVAVSCRVALERIYARQNKTLVLNRLEKG
jgi:HEAT repeat protein